MRIQKFGTETACFQAVTVQDSCTAGDFLWCTELLILFGCVLCQASKKPSSAQPPIHEQLQIEEQIELLGSEVTDTHKGDESRHERTGVSELQHQCTSAKASLLNTSQKASQQVPDSKKVGAHSPTDRFDRCGQHSGPAR